jgi:hypothetical protein
MTGRPPGWPDGVRPPEVAGWQGSATSWLLDLCPADYRGYSVLTRHPLALVHLAGAHVGADLKALREARAGARASLAEVLDARSLAEVLGVLDIEEARLIAARRGVTLVEQALRGRRHIPRL